MSELHQRKWCSKSIFIKNFRVWFLNGRILTCWLGPFKNWTQWSSLWLICAFLFFIVFDHANACTSMHLLVEIHNKLYFWSCGFLLFRFYGHFYLFIHSSGFLFIWFSGFGLTDRLTIEHVLVLTECQIIWYFTFFKSKSLKKIASTLQHTLHVHSIAEVDF